MRRLLVAALLVSAFMGMGMTASAQPVNIGPVDVATNVGVVTAIQTLLPINVAVLGTAVQDVSGATQVQITTLHQQIDQTRNNIHI